MANQVSWKKLLITTIICSMFAGTAAYADEPTGAGSMMQDTAAESTGMGGVLNAAAPAGSVSPFPDVADSHWAMKHIAKLYYQDIVEGTPDGKFNPSSSVSQQEAVLMALRFMGLNDQVDDSVYISFPADFQVSNYFKKYIWYAMQEGLLDENEEFQLAAANPGTAWGTKPASREWVTKLVVRAIGQEEAAQQQALHMPSFNDAGLIQDRYVGYVNTAVDLDLVKGITATRFDPKGAVNRAQMATFLSRAQYQYAIDPDGQESGIITSLTATSLTLTDANGLTKMFALTPETLIYRHDAETPIAAAGLKPYTAAIVMAKEGRALYVEQTDDTERLERISGTFESVDNGQIWIRVGSSFQSIAVDRQIAVIDGSGASLTLDALPEGSEVDIYRDTFRSSKLAVRIELKGGPVNKSGSGKITGISGNVVTITENGAAAGQAWTIAPTAVISKQGGTVLLSDLRIGDAVSFVVANNLVTNMTIDSSADRTAVGTFDSFSADGKSIIYNVNGKLSVSPLAPYATLLIEGFAGAAWSDLNKADMLELSLNGSEQVTAVKVTNRNIVTLPSAAIVSYDATSKFLTLKDTNGDPLVFRLTDKTRIEMNGTQMTLDAARSLLTTNQKLTVAYSDKSIVSIKFLSRHTGTLTSLNTFASQAVLRLEDGTSITVPYVTPAPAVEIIGKTSSVLADVKTGDTVTLLLDANRDRAAVIQVHRVLQQTIASVDAPNRRIRLTNAEGATSDYAIPFDASLYNAAGQTALLSHYSEGQTVNVSFVGKTIASIQLIDLKVGRVVASVPGAVTLRDYSGSIHDVNLGSSYRVMKNGITSTSTAVLAEGDRITVGKDERGDNVIHVLSGTTKRFWRYDAAAGELHMRRASLNDESFRYKLYADTVISSASGARLSASSLKADDTLVLYTLNGKLIEVVKV